MKRKVGLLVVGAALSVVACGGKSTSSKDETSRRSTEAIKGGDASKGKQSQGNQAGQGKQGDGQQGGDTLISCEFKSDDGLVDCGSLDTVLVPAQAAPSRFDVRYEFSCGEEGVVSPLGLATDQQYRAFIFGAKNTVSLFGKGPLAIRSKKEDLDALKASGTDLTGCRLLVKVVKVQPVSDIFPGTPGTSAGVTKLD